MKTIIFQSSPPHTASTVLANTLYGLIPSLKDKPVFFKNLYTNDPIVDLDELCEDIIVLKTHNTDIDELIDKYGEKYKLFFVSSERSQKNLLINDKYKSYNNVIIFSFEELNENENNTIYNIVKNIHDKIKNKLNIELNIDEGINRIVLMNNLYETIKDKDFKYYDKFYHIHGSHRNRK